MCSRWTDPRQEDRQQNLLLPNALSLFILAFVPVPALQWYVRDFPYCSILRLVGSELDFLGAGEGLFRNGMNMNQGLDIWYVYGQFYPRLVSPIKQNGCS